MGAVAAPWDEPWVRNHLGGTDGIDVVPLASNRWLTDGIWRASRAHRSVIVKVASVPVKRAVAGAGENEVFAEKAAAHNSDEWSRHWTEGSMRPTHWNYWKREFLAYAHDLPGSFADHGVTAPLLLHSAASADTVTLVVEDCSARPATDWAAEDYLAAAQNIGVAHARLTSFDAGNLPWLCRDYLPDYAVEKPFDRGLPLRQSAWTAARSVGVEDPDWIDALRRFASMEPDLLRICARSPTTLSHNDFWTKNLFGNTNGPTIAIDWAFVGVSAIGADLANLVASAAFDGYVPAADVAEFGEHAFDAYLKGLRAGGLDTDSAVVYHGYLSAFGKYGWVVAAMLRSAADPAHPNYVGYGRGTQMDFATVAGTLVGLSTWICGRISA